MINLLAQFLWPRHPQKLYGGSQKDFRGDGFPAGGWYPVPMSALYTAVLKFAVQAFVQRSNGTGPCSGQCSFGCSVDGSAGGVPSARAAVLSRDAQVFADRQAPGTDSREESAQTAQKDRRQC